MELEQVCNGSLFEMCCSPCPMRTSPPPDFPSLSRRFPRRNRTVVKPILCKYFARPNFLPSFLRLYLGTRFPSPTDPPAP